MIAWMYVTFCDIRNVGGILSWNNKAIGPSRNSGRLDRVLVNSLLLSSLPNAYYVYLNCATSDHCPTLIHLIPVTNRGPKPFKYFTYWQNVKVMPTFLKLGTPTALAMLFIWS